MTTRRLLILVSLAILQSTLTFVQGQTTQIIYTTDQNSNTVTVVDATAQQVLGKITLGYPSSDPRVFSPLYNGDINVHGISYDPVYQKVAIVSTVSNSLTMIDAQTGIVLKRAYVGRNPHEPRFTNDGKEIWVTVRGENYISVLDAASLKEKQRIELSEGPGMVAFSKTGSIAFICSSFDDNFWVVDAKTKKIIKTIKVPSLFSPFVNVSPDGNEVWVAHKDNGTISRIDSRKFTIIETFNTGKISNHVGFAGKYRIVTVGAENKVKVFEIAKNNKAALVKEIDTDPLPHGVWGNESGSEVYVVTELGNSLHIIDANSWAIKKTLPIGEKPQTLIPVTLTKSLEQLKENINQYKPVFKGPKN